MTLDDLDAALLERRGAVDRGACGRRGLAGVAQHSIEGRPVAAVRILARKRGEAIYATGWSSRLRARA